MPWRSAQKPFRRSIVQSDRNGKRYFAKKAYKHQQGIATDLFDCRLVVCYLHGESLRKSVEKLEFLCYYKYKYTKKIGGSP